MAIDRRIVGLDAWRALLLLGGPITHAAGLIGAAQGDDNLVWALATWSTHLFRMQAFFFISGLVSSLAASRKQDWLPLRMAQLGVPLLVSWICLLVPQVLIQHQITGYPIRNVISPEHLWFLYGLIAATLIALLFKRQLTAIANVVDGMSLLPVILLWCVGAAIVAGITPYLENMTAEHANLSGAVIGKARYGGYYLAGVVFSQCPRLIDSVRATGYWTVGLILPILGLGVYGLTVESIGLANLSLPIRALLEATVAPTSVFMCITIAHTAFRMRAVPGFLWRLSRASFTVYLFHLPLMNVLALLPGLDLANPYLAFALLSYLSLTLSLLIHHLFARYEWFRIAFNGRIEGRAKTRYQQWLANHRVSSSYLGQS